MSRHPELGNIDRSRTLRFVFDGREYHGHPGDTLASALLANGVRRVGTSTLLGRPRGIFSAGAEEPNAVVQIEEPFPEPMVLATTTELYDGLVARSLSGRGRLADRPDPCRYDAVHAHCDVLVVGAGPAGAAAARAAESTGARVIIADSGPPAADRTRAYSAPDPHGLGTGPQTRVLARTTVVGYYDDNYLVAVERRTAHLGLDAPPDLARERVWRIRAKRVVLATGAHERPIAFAGNDLPGVMLAGSARTYLHRYGVLPGHRAVVFTTNDSAYATALDLAAAGLTIAAIADSRPEPAQDWADRARAAGIEVLAGQLVTEARGDGEVASVLVGTRELPADLLLVSGGWNPVVHLFSQSGGTLRYDERLGALVPGESPQAVEVVGAAGGDLGHGSGEPLWFVPAGDYSRHFVDLQRDVTVADVWRATGAGLTSVEHVKRYTTAGTAHDQGKTSGALTSALVAHATGVAPGGAGVTTFRAPYLPVSFAALAGRDRGALHDPVRITALHDWHAARGALFENVGQWRRPWYYPRAGEDMAAAVLRECRAAREHVAAMDASTLGKIDVIGPDAAEFLDRLYTNLMSSLAVGSIRYGVMCRPDGMVFDDGTAIRLAEDHYLITTTTGNAAAVLDWMEEWLQTEWPDLRVTCTSVTEQWATVALVGPGSRAVLGDLAPGLAVDRAGFPFMTWRETEVAGIPARVCRISFSGELAYEINVSSWYGLSLWEAVMSRDVTPYGTETMHVLRAEKGYPIVGQDTDGTTTPQDLGMEWIVSKKKPDFLGKRSFTRRDTARPDRRRLVGLLPRDPEALLPEGAALLAGDRMAGHVTSSYPSAALGRTFALALVSGTHTTLTTRSGVAADVTSSVLYDPGNTRRDGAETETAAPPAGGFEAPVRRSPLAGFEAEFDGLRLAEAPFLTQVNVRTGTPLTPPGTAVTDGETTTVWLGPDEWLTVGPGAARGVDVSAQRTAIRITGPRARDLLAHGCALDLHPDVFPPGRCAQTLLARTQIILIAESDGFLVLVRASFAAYLGAWLLDAATEF
ncbi:sarcosine oxidase subunit alpha [Acrocarpospora phusangensis]|uniref:Sarcosine oxidase subunit alpha n=1 Tax=Acrocarpospora phusangensis TaxID=1070424 RepID=A0A919Q752_9ACTN|nr:2Fe-2S iron-sulfur cluster-binding protein [Acrocarpospora phusangensis]GIH21870.1 sarcosine oxidase subunit alpha [Acrocarpospora phusangensis]